MVSTISSGSLRSMKKKSPSLSTDSWIGITPWLTRWALTTIRLRSAWRKISVSRTTSTASERIRSASTRPGPTDGELVDVADQDQAAVVRHRPQHVVGEHRVEHRRLVDDQQVGRERVLAVAVELPGLRVELEQPVEGGRLGAGGLGHALGGAAGGGGEQHALALLLQDLDDAAHQRRLAGAGAAGDHQHLARQPGADRLPLLAGE